MAAAALPHQSPLPTFLLLISTLLLFFFLTPTTSSTTTKTSTLPTNITTTICNSTPFPSSCISSLKLSISIPISIPPVNSPIPPVNSILSLLLHSLNSAISECTSLLPLLVPTPRLVELRKYPIRDCNELHQATLSSLNKTTTIIQSSKIKIEDAKAQLSAALTNKATCLDGMEGGVSGEGKGEVVERLVAAYSHVSNSLSLVSMMGGGKGRGRRVMERFPAWVSAKNRRLLETGDYDGYDPASILTVAADGSENFTTISDAILFAPKMSDDRTLIIIRAGYYDENVNIPIHKTNIVMLGEGSDVTVIRGNRSVGDGWTTFRSATVAVSGEGFLARDLTFVNVAGAAKHQAVALRVNADLSAIYRCVIDGYQDTLYVHSFRQFYRDSLISGTIDFIFGNAAVVFQNCNIYAKLPMPGQFITITAQSREDPYEATGISIQNCSIVPSDELANSSGLTRAYLGRPWKNYSTTVYMESYLDGIVDPSGWCKWAEDDNGALDTLYYGEYLNYGPGAGTDGRVNWTGFHLMDYDDAYSFSVSEFIYGDQWLDSTSIPYDDGV